MHEVRAVDCLSAEGMVSLADRSVDVVITDPPYSKHTHEAQRIGCTGYRERPGTETSQFSRTRTLGFAPLTPEVRLACAQQFARLSKRWVIVFSDHEGSLDWGKDLTSAGLNVVRYGVWIKVGCTPQFSGDRPAVGHEVIVIAHPKGKKHWNGGGQHAVWTVHIALHRGIHRVHTTQKPVVLMEALIRDFTDPGELILDPFAGSGTTLVAARKLGRNAIGYETDAHYAAVAQERIADTREQLQLASCAAESLQTLLW